MRVLNRPLAFILAAALTVASIIVIIEVIAAAGHHGPVVLHWTTWYRWAQSTRWDSRVVQVWSAILIVAGVLILALELKPPRVTRLRLHAGHQDTDAALTRGGLAGTLRAAATSIDGITGAAVTVRRGRAVVSGQGCGARPGRSRRPEAAGHRRGAQPPGWPGHEPPAAPEGARDVREPLMHADRTNRTALIVFGSLVLLAGAAGMLTSVGVFSNAFSKHALFANQVSTYIGKNGRRYSS